MAIKPDNVRISTTITREQDELLGAIAAFQGRSKGSYLRELLDGAEPLFRALVPALRTHAATVEGQPAAMRDVVAQVMTGAYGDDGLDMFHAVIGITERIEDERSARSEARTSRSASRPRKARS